MLKMFKALQHPTKTVVGSSSCFLRPESRILNQWTCGSASCLIAWKLENRRNL